VSRVFRSATYLAQWIRLMMMMMWNDSEEEGMTVKMNTVTLIGKGR
jgi:hypothetical protein